MMNASALGGPLDTRSLDFGSFASILMLHSMVGIGGRTANNWSFQVLPLTVMPAEDPTVIATFITFLSPHKQCRFLLLSYLEGGASCRGSVAPGSG